MILSVSSCTSYISDSVIHILYRLSASFAPSNPPTSRHTITTSQLTLSTTLYVLMSTLLIDRLPSRGNLISVYIDHLVSESRSDFLERTLLRLSRYQRMYNEE